MKTNKKSTLSLIAMVLVLIMVLTPVVSAMPAFAYQSNDKPAEGTTHDGTPLPEGAEEYGNTGVPSDELAGEGTKENPYLIADAADFVCFYKNYAAIAEAYTYFKLTGDVYLNSETYGTEGNHFDFGYTMPNFLGVLDGDGYVIYNLYARGDHRDHALFTTVKGTIKNLTFDGVRAIGANIAVLCLNLYGTLENISIKNAVIRGSKVGGLSLNVNPGAYLIGCSLSGTVTATGEAGGMAASYTNSAKEGPVRMINCVNNADITTTGTGDSISVGGMLGVASNTASVSGYEFTNCVNNGAITGKNAAGILGRVWRVRDFANFDYCVNNGNITSTSNAGGIIAAETSGGGDLSVHTYIRNCINRGNIVAAEHAGGMSGTHVLANRALYIISCVNYGNVDGYYYSGGMVGRLNDEWGNGSSLVVTNSTNFGDVGTAGTSLVSGAVCGGMSFSKASITVNGLVSTGDVTAVNRAAAILGASTKVATNIKANDTWVQGTMTVTSTSGAIAIANAAASVTGGAVTLKNCGFDLTFSIGEASVEASTIPTICYTADGSVKVGYNNGTAEVTDQAYPAEAPETFMASALASMNAAAAESGNTAWVANDIYGLVPETIALVLTNEEALNHSYNRTAVEARYTIGDTNIASVEVLYYAVADLTTPLAGAPVVPGDYRVVLQGKDADGANYGNAVTVDYTISKGSVRFDLTSDHTVKSSNPEDLAYTEYVFSENKTDYSGTYRAQYSAYFKGTSFEFVAKLCAYSNQVYGELLGEYLTPTKTQRLNASDQWEDIAYEDLIRVGTYRVIFEFAETEYYKATTQRWKLTITKGTIGYPAADTEGRWTVPTDWNDTEQSVTFNSIQGDLSPFDVVLSGDTSATDATPDGTTLKATATLTLKEDWAADCDLSGTAPVYEVEWRLNKAPTKLVLYGPDGNPVADPTAIRLEYSGETTTYVVKLLDENGNILNENVETFSLTSVTKIEKSVTVASDAVDSNHTVPDALQICLEVTPVLIEIEVGTIADKTYDGEALSAEAVTVTMTEPTGTTWNEYEKVWQKWNAETEKWETVTEVKNVGKYRLYVTRTLVVEEGVEPDCMAEGSSPAFIIEKEIPTLIWNTEGFTLKGDKYVVTYDGMQKVIGATSENINLTLDNIVVEYSADGETYLPDAPILCGSYYVRVTFTGDENYEAVENFAPIQMEIEKQSFTLPESIWNYTEPYTYTGSAFTVGVARKLVENKNAYIDYKIIGETRTAQGSYKATIYIWSLQPDSVMLVAHDGSELTLEEYDGKSAYKSELSWTIQKATPDMDALDFTAPDSLVYDGADHRVTVDLSSHPYLTATYVTTCNGEVVASNAVIGAGDYVVSVTFTLNNSNYTEIPVGKETMQISFTIDKKVIDIADLVITGTEVTYNGQPHRVEIDLPDYMEQGTAVYTLNGVAVDVAEAAGEYTVTIPLTLLDTDNYEMNEDAIETTMTIAKAVYPASAYKLEDTFVLIFNDEIGADGADFIAVINAMLETLGKSLPAGNIITVANAAELPVMKTPGEATFTVRFAGSANYEAITGTKEVTLVVKPIIVTPSAENSDVTVGFPEGAPDDVEVKLEKLEPTDELKDALSANADITFNADFYGIWKFTAIDEDGSPITAEACDWTIRIQLDKDAQKAYKEGNLHVSKRAGEKLATFKNYEYNEESGVLTLRLTSKDELTATYAVAIPKNMTGLIVGIVAGVIVLAAAIGGIVALVIVRKKKRAAMFAEYENIDTDYTADDSYTGYVPEEGVEYVGTEESYGESYDGFDEEMSVDETVDESYDDTTPTDDDSDQ